MIPLPIDSHLPEILRSLRESRALVLVAEPGAGKTTRVAPAIVRSNLLSSAHPNLVMLQPRRVAAWAAAQRIADENGWRVGQQVGWHIRFERRIQPNTRLRVLTEGILVRQLLDDPFLEGVGCVVLDEFHERSIHTDLSIALLREIQQTVREDLILIVMSATLDADPISKFLGDCPIIRVAGRTFPVEISHAPIASAEPIERRVAVAIEKEFENIDGDALVFLPGVAEIERAARAIRSDAQVVPLHGSLPIELQSCALDETGSRKIILATNIAETSLTVPRVRLVIDSGLARVASYDPQRGLDRLDLARISKASAAQRAGRAGRTAAGKCVRLYTSREFHAMPDFEVAEIHRIDLAGTILSLHAWGRPDVLKFSWFDPPPRAAIESAERLLQMLGAIDRGQITAIGKRIAALPLHPRLGRLLIEAADNNVADQGATIAALLSEKDILQIDRADRSPRWQGESDLILRMNLLENGGDEVDLNTAARVRRIRDDLRRIVSISKTSSIADSSSDAILRLPLLAYPDRVCRRRIGDRSAGVMVGGGGVRLAHESVVRQHELFVAIDVRHDDRSASREAAVRIASAIEENWLDEISPHAITNEQTAIFDESRQRVIGVARKRYHDLILREDSGVSVDPERAGEVLADALAGSAAQRFADDETAKRWLARIDLLSRFMPEQNLPVFDSSALETILCEMCANKKRAEELKNVSAIAHLEARLSFQQKQLMSREAPESMVVPSGSRIAIQYAIGQPPVLAARLQELFGWTQTPRIVTARVPIVLHLLAPNFRPVQITNDLKSFWANTYFQVRRDLRVKYPRHSWPDDPLNAPPQAKGGRRR